MQDQGRPLLRLRGVCGLWGTSSGKAGFSEERVGDRLSRPGEGGHPEPKSRRGKEVRMGPARGGLVDVNREKGGPSHLRGFGFFLKWSDHL